LEKNMMATTAANLHNSLYQAQEERKLALSRFQWTCYSPTSIVPADSEQTIFYTNTGDSISSLHANYFNSQVDEKKAAIKVEQSHFFPEISVGYSRQNILPLKNLNAWSVGISFPLFFAPQSSKVKQAKIAAMSAQIQADSNIREVNNKIAELQASMRRYNESLKYYSSTALKEADELMKSSELQLKNNETSVTEFIQSITAARDIRRGYIETIYNYNIAALEYELYK
jgi:cobalt-zinc-cadmium resistance protein CzcA